MKKCIYLILFITSIAYTQIPSQNYPTLAHELIGWEQRAPGNGKTSKDIASYYIILDSIIDVCKVVLPKYNHEFNEIEVKDTFTKIDSVLYSFGFYTCYTTEILSDAFTPINMSKGRGCQGCVYYDVKEKDCNGSQIVVNTYRKKFTESLSRAFRLDCDLASILYYSIGQVMNYPLFMVEVPNHNFIRWHSALLSKNWDTNAGKSYDDDTYRKGESATACTSFKKAEEEEMKYLTDMDASAIKNYYLPVLGLTYKKRGLRLAAEYIYNGIIEEFPNNEKGYYYQAWMFLYSPELIATKVDEAYSLAKKAFDMVTITHINPDENEIIETYACACASKGEFEKAILLVRSSTKNRKLILGFEEGLKCHEIVPNR